MRSKDATKIFLGLLVLGLAANVSIKDVKFDPLFEYSAPVKKAKGVSASKNDKLEVAGNKSQRNLALDVSKGKTGTERQMGDTSTSATSFSTGNSKSDSALEKLFAKVQKLKDDPFFDVQLDLGFKLGSLGNFVNSPNIPNGPQFLTSSSNSSAFGAFKSRRALHQKPKAKKSKDVLKNYLKFTKNNPKALLGTAKSDSVKDSKADFELSKNFYKML